MPPNKTDQGVAALREVAPDVTTDARKVTSAFTAMETLEAIASARADLRRVRQEFERLYALTKDDPAEDRERRRGTIQMELARLDESEARLDAAERTLVTSSHAKS